MSTLRRSRRVVTLDMVVKNPAIIESLGLKALLPLIVQLAIVKERLSARRRSLPRK
jgi:hypothetical protein